MNIFANWQHTIERQMNNNNEMFAIIITEKISLGYIAIPYIISTEKQPMLKPLEPVTLQHISSNKYDLNDIETQLVKILGDINEQAIFKRFSREKNMKTFYEKLTQNIYDEHIRPFIEKRLVESISLIAQYDIPTYHKTATYNQIYESDKLLLSSEFHRTRFHFSLNNNELSYSLKIPDGVQDVVLRGKNIVEIASNPAILLIGNKIYRFQNIDSRKFRPFTQKNRITIPEKNVPMYMQSYVANCIKHHYVVAYGFSIKKRCINPKPILYLEQNILHPVLSLQFRYEDKLHPFDSDDNTTVDLVKEDDRYVFYKSARQFKQESDVANLICEMGLKRAEGSSFVVDKSSTFDSNGLHNLVEWLNTNQEELIQRGIEVEQRGFQQKFYEGSVELRMEMKEDNDWFDIYGIVILKGFEIPFIKFRKYLINNQREYKLPNGEIFILPEVWFTNYSEMMPFINEDTDHIKLGKMHSSLLPLDLAPDQSMADRIANIHKINIERQGELLAELRPYQSEGFSWMLSLHENKFGGILADDMGLGKTLQTIALLVHLYSEKGNADTSETEKGEQLDIFETNTIEGYNNTGIPASLIVMPVSLLHNWKNEIRKFAPQLKVYDYSGRNRFKSNDIGKVLRHYHIVITSYGMVRNDYNFLQSYSYNYIILDESQNIKNPFSKTYQAISSLQSKYKLTISGTPIENSLNDLWAQMNFVNQGLLGSQTFFKNHFDIPISKNNDEDAEAKLKKLIAPFILRRTKDLVAKDLPPISEQTLYCEMTPEQRELYEREKSGVRNEIIGTINNIARNNTTFIALQALTRLRLLANHPLLTHPQYEGGSGKFDQVLERIDNVVAEGHKLLVFSSFVRDLELIGNELHNRNLKYSKLIGSTTDREAVIKTFTNNNDCNIFLISLKAGGVGLNLTSADYVFVLNPWWNPASEAQAINRAHRIGQTKSVFVYKFITADTIEEKIARLQEKKLQLASNMITCDNPLRDMTEDEIRELFS